MKVDDVLSANDRASLQQALRSVYDTLMNLEVPDSEDPDDSEPESDDGPPTRLIIGPFVELPDKKLYFDYYQVILNPIAMEGIDKKIKNYQYRSLKEFGKDITLLATNCRTYNEDGSMLFQDATTLEVCGSHSSDSYPNRANLITRILANKLLMINSRSTQIWSFSRMGSHRMGSQPRQDQAWARLELPWLLVDQESS